MTKTEIEESVLIIRQVMDMEVDVSDPVGVLDKLNGLSNVLGLSGNLIAHAKRNYNIKAKSMLGELFAMKTTDRKLYLDTKATDEQFLVDETTALNKDLHYNVESCRSMLSYIKQEMLRISQ